jgi:hypothetical protein
LQWRFDRFPARQVYERFWLYQAETVVGYVVLRIAIHNGVAAAFIVDYLCEPASLRSLLALTLNTCRERGAAIAYCATLNPSAGRMFRPLCFLRRKSGWPFMAYTQKCSTEIRRMLAKRNSWFLTLADSNLDHAPAMAQAPASERAPP